MKAAADVILPLVEKIPAFSQSVSRTLALASDVNCSPRDLVEVVSLDPVLTLKMLKLVNSAAFGLAQKVTSVRHALVYLGLNALKNIALSLALMGAFPKKNQAGFDVEAFWLHSLGTGAAARLLAKRRGASEGEAEDHFVAGLLHDVGKLVFAKHEPEKFRQALALVARDGAPLWEAEGERIGAGHAEVASMLAVRWELPGELAVCLGRHHEEAEGQPSAMLDAVCAADGLVKLLGFGFSGDPRIAPLSPARAARLGADLDGLRQELPELPEALDKARALIHL